MGFLKKLTVLYNPPTPRLIALIVYIACFFLESLAFALVLVYIKSICVAAHEISTSVLIFSLTIQTPIISDLVYIILGLKCSRFCYAPFGSGYNLVIGVLCFLISFFCMCFITLCGNSAQIAFIVAYLLGILVGLIHGAYAAFSYFVEEIKEQN